MSPLNDWVFSSLAMDEFEAILDYVASESRSLAVTARVQVDFIEAFDRLADSPLIGSTRPELTGTSIRWWPVRSYLIVYDPTTSPLRILRIVHGARDLPRLFKGLF